MDIYFLSPAFFSLLCPHDQRIRLLFISNEFLIVYFFVRLFFFLPLAFIWSSIKQIILQINHCEVLEL